MDPATSCRMTTGECSRNRSSPIHSATDCFNPLSRHEGGRNEIGNKKGSKNKCNENDINSPTVYYADIIWGLEPLLPIESVIK